MAGLLAHKKAIAYVALAHVQRNAQPVDSRGESELFMLAGRCQARELDRRLQLASVDANPAAAGLFEQGA